MNNQKGGAFFTFVIFVTFFLSIGFIIQYFFDPIGHYLRLKDEQRVKDLATMQQAFELYYKYEGRYPDASYDHKIIGTDGKPVDWGGSWQPFIQQLPKDPDRYKNYAYITEGDDQSFAVYTSLDAPELFKKTCEHYHCVRPPEDACGPLYEVACNYGVSSSNIAP